MTPEDLDRLKEFDPAQFNDDFLGLAENLDEDVTEYLEEIRTLLDLFGVETNAVSCDYIEGSDWRVFKRDRLEVRVSLFDGGETAEDSEGNLVLGVNVHLRVFTSDDEDIYDVIPHNWTPKCWLPVTDEEAVRKRIKKMFEVHPPTKVVQDLLEANP